LKRNGGEESIVSGAPIPPPEIWLKATETEGYSARVKRPLINESISTAIQEN